MDRQHTIEDKEETNSYSTSQKCT